MSKGSDAERELVTWFWERGYAALRAPGSGSIDRPSPDVFSVAKWVLNTNAYAIEVKAAKDGTTQLDKQKVEELREWADRAGARPFVVVKPDQRSFDGWLCFPPHELNETENGYSVRLKDHNNALTRAEAFEPNPTQ